MKVSWIIDVFIPRSPYGACVTGRVLRTRARGRYWLPPVANRKLAAFTPGSVLVWPSPWDKQVD